MRYAVLLVVLAAGCSGDPLWTSCDGDPASCGEGFACVERARQPLTPTVGYYCAPGCVWREPPEDGAADCRRYALETNEVGCTDIGGGAGFRHCVIVGCETDDDCPDDLRCIDLSRPGAPHSGVCEP